MFEEECLHCGQDATGTTFILEYRIVHFLVEVEALGPARVEAWSPVPEQEFFDARCFFRGQC
jgi:hypothetical protein